MEFLFKDDYLSIKEDYHNIKEYINYDFILKSYNDTSSDTMFLVGLCSKKYRRKEDKSILDNVPYYIFIIETKIDSTLTLFAEVDKKFFNELHKNNFLLKISNLKKNFQNSIKSENTLKDIEQQTIHRLPLLKIGFNDFFNLIFTIHAYENITIYNKKDEYNLVETFFISNSNFYFLYGESKKNKLEKDIEDWLINLFNNHFIPSFQNINFLIDFIYRDIQSSNKSLTYNRKDFGASFIKFLEISYINYFDFKKDLREEFTPQKKFLNFSICNKISDLFKRLF